MPFEIRIPTLAQAFAITILVVAGLFLAAETAWPQSQTPQAQNPQAQAVAAACRADIQSHCTGISPGGGRIAICLRDNREKLSGPCRDALIKARAAQQGSGN